jgi:hypothetical protein
MKNVISRGEYEEGAENDDVMELIRLPILFSHRENNLKSIK